MSSSSTSLIEISYGSLSKSRCEMNLGRPPLAARSLCGRREGSIASTFKNYVCSKKKGEQLRGSGKKLVMSNKDEEKEDGKELKTNG